MLRRPRRQSPRTARWTILLLLAVRNQIDICCFSKHSFRINFSMQSCPMNSKGRSGRKKSSSNFWESIIRNLRNAVIRTEPRWRLGRSDSPRALINPNNNYFDVQKIRLNLQSRIDHMHSRYKSLPGTKTNPHRSKFFEVYDRNLWPNFVPKGSVSGQLTSRNI